MTLERALRTVALTGVFALPFIALYVSSSLFFPFITGKNFAFRVIVEIAAGAYLALALIQPMYRPKRGWLLWAFAAFVAIIAAADIFGVYPHKSFWSNYERMEGFVTLVHLFVYFVVASSILNTEKLWKQWWHTTLGVSVIVAFTGLFQLLGFVTINQGDIRLDARLGNSTYLGVYMLFHVFIAALYLAKAWVENGPEKRRGALWLYGSIIALNSFILFFTATRGAILGLIGGMVFAAVLMAFVASGTRAKWLAAAAIAGCLVFFGGLVVARDQAWVKSVEPLFRLSTLTTDLTTFSRFMNWGMAFEGFKERPILGWGQENYAAVFDNHYDPDMWGQEPWFDRVHNIIFDWLIAGGILGLLAYLSLHAFALLAIWRSGAFAPYERAILTGLLAGYFFYLLFTFDNLTSYLLFGSLLAYIATRAYAAKATLAPMFALPRGAVPVVAIGTIVLTCGTAWFVNAAAIAQNRTLIMAISPQPQGPQKNLEYFKKAASYDSVGQQEAREQFAQAAIGIVGAQNIPNDLKQQFVTAALEEMEKQAADAPRNARAPFFKGLLMDRAGMYADANEALARAREATPTKQSIIFEQGLNAFARNATDEAVQFFKEAYDLAPAYPEAQKYYAAALIRAGKDGDADTLIRAMMEQDTAADPRIASAYASRSQYAKIAEIWRAHIAKTPADTEARFVLAGAYYSGGNPAEAIATLEEIKRVAPESAAQAEGLIQQVRSGQVE